MARTATQRLSRALRQTYEAAGFTQVRLSEATGIDQQTISKYARGAVQPSLDVVVAVEDACGAARGSILRLAGYVSDELDVASALRSDPHLDAEGRELVSSLYAYCRRKRSSEDADLVAAYRRSLIERGRVDHVATLDRLHPHEQLAIAREWQRHLADDDQEQLAG